MSRRLDVAADREAALDAAAEALRAGRAVVLPTDTVYAVAADAFNPIGTRRIFGAKRRSRRFPLPVLVRTPKQLLGLCAEVPRAADRLMAAYWPGPLTLVLAADPGLEWDLGDARGTVAVRMPLDDLVLDLVREVGPLAATSANLAGQPPASTAEGAQQQLADQVAVYLDPRPAGRPAGGGAAGGRRARRRPGRPRPPGGRRTRVSARRGRAPGDRGRPATARGRLTAERCPARGRWHTLVGAPDARPRPS